MDINSWSKTKNIFLIIFLVSICFAFVYISSNFREKKEKISISPTKVVRKTILDQPKEQIERYFLVYQDPYVIYLRKALDTYLSNDTANINIADAAVQTDKQGGIISGLDSFSKDYYKSKFAVVNINDSIAGGKDIQILFQSKPDRIFHAWVYDLADDNYELRGFDSKENIDQKALKDLIDYTGPLLLDKTHAL